MDTALYSVIQLHVNPSLSEGGALEEHLNAAHDGAHVLSYDSRGKRGAAHFPHMSAAFTLHPDLPSPSLLPPSSLAFFFI